MASSTPVRDLAGKIVGLQDNKEVDPVQATLDASMQAVGAMPEVTPPPTTRPLPPPPSLRIEMVALVVTLVVVGFTFLPKGNSPAPHISAPTVTAAPTGTPLPSATPTNIIPINPRAVTLSAVALYGDYDEATKIGAAPVGIACVLAGQSPDGLWAYIECPVPTGHVWAKVEDLELSAVQRDTLLDTRVIARIVPTVPAFSPSAPPGTGPALAFCADRSSIWGRTRQCGPTQAAADSLADSDIRAINAAAEALNKRQHP